MAGRASVALGLKYGTGDLITQSATKAPDDAFDTRRSGMFLGFGAYYGVINYHVFRLLQASPWPVHPWPKALASACFDGFVNVPVGFYPQFYCFKEVVTSTENRSLLDHCYSGLAKYGANWRADILTSAAVFVPLGIVNFRFVPLAWRTPVLSVFGLVFPIALSFQRGKGE